MGTAVLQFLDVWSCFGHKQFLKFSARFYENRKLQKAKEQEKRDCTNEIEKVLQYEVTVKMCQKKQLAKNGRSFFMCFEHYFT